MKEMIGKLRRQADILNNVAKRFSGEYAWIEKAGMHASEVSLILGESVRRMKEAAAEIERLNDRRILDENKIHHVRIARLEEENEDLKLIVSTLQDAAQKTVDVWERVESRVGIEPT